MQGEALFSDEVITEVLKQGDSQPIPVPEASHPEPRDPGPEQSEPLAESQAGSNPMPEPKPDQVPQSTSENETPQDLHREDPSPHGPVARDAVDSAEPQRETPTNDEAVSETAADGLAQSDPVTGTPSEQPVAAAETVLEQSTAQHAAAKGACGPHHQSESAKGDHGQVFAVDRGTRLVAESCECEELVVDGHLEAAARARRLRLGREGRFAGSAEVEFAEIHGRCEGKLIVTGRLVILAGATVSGTTRYRQIVIEAGGAILGQAQLLPEAPVEAARFEADGQAAVSPMPAQAAQV